MFGYLGQPIEAPIMHLTSGELVRLITSDAYWPLFKDFFRASKQVVTLKLQEIGDIRNALAHFRPLTQDDVEAVKQNAKQVLSSAEDALESMILCSQRVPSNTTDAWYRELRTLGTDICSFEFNQSADSRWIRFLMFFNARIITQEPQEPWGVIRYRVLNIDTPEILKRYNELRSLTIYLTERVNVPTMPADLKPSIRKRLEFTFSRPTLMSEYTLISENLKRLLTEIDNEAELLADDDLAKGNLLHLVRVTAHRREWEDHTYWDVDNDTLRCSVGSHHPTEYWGSITMPSKDLVSDSEQYPWMPIPISESEPQSLFAKAKRREGFY
jgi:hypothetical protein